MASSIKRLLAVGGDLLLNHLAELTRDATVMSLGNLRELVLHFGGDPGADKNDFGGGGKIFLHFHAMKCSM
jgi:hypothetical protein